MRPTGTELEAGCLARVGVRLISLIPRVPSLHGDIEEIGQGDGPVNGCGYLLRASTQIDLVLVVSQ